MESLSEDAEIEVFFIIYRINAVIDDELEAGVRDDMRQVIKEFAEKHFRTR